MRLRVKKINLNTGGPFVVVLNEDDAELLDVRALDRITIKGIEAIVDISKPDHRTAINQGEIGVLIELFDALRLKSGGLVNIRPANKPESLAYIRKKLDGKKLTDQEINAVIKDVVKNKLSETELTYFVSGCYTHGLEMGEVVSLTNAIVEHGGRLSWNKKIILDKHCAGGIAGNRTSMVIVPIIAAAGYTIPKTSSRAISSASGTADTVESLCPVSFNVNEIKKIVNKTNGCLVWGGAIGMASADDRLIKIEKLLSLDPRGILLASIMAKKMSVGATHVLVDIPCGKEAKIKDMKEALKLKRQFIELSKRLSINTRVIITNGSQPIGNGIGPNLEAMDVINVLNGKGPVDLREKSLHMAGIMLEMIGVKGGLKMAKEILDSRLAYKKMIEIIKAQGGGVGRIEKIRAGRYRKEFFAKKSGIVKRIDNNKANSTARIAGAPEDKAGGILLNAKKNSKIKKGELIFTIFSSNKDRLRYASENANGLFEIN